MKHTGALEIATPRDREIAMTRNLDATAGHDRLALLASPELPGMENGAREP